MAELFSAASIIALITLTALEIVLGVDNLVFIAILTNQMPTPKQQKHARRLGLALASIGRIILLLLASWIVTLDQKVLIALPEMIDLSAHDLVLLIGGLFLLAKATWEIHSSVTGNPSHDGSESDAAHASTGRNGRSSEWSIIGQILLLDLVFSVDSVLTAVGMVEPEKYTSAPIPFTTIAWPAFTIMAVAVLAAIAIMLWFIGPVGNFIERHPAFKMLALSFLLLIGIVLVADGLHQHISRAYIYFAMGFSTLVEFLNLGAAAHNRRRRAAKRPGPV